MKKIVDDFHPIPAGYGVAYVDYACRRAICYPIPLNLVIRLFRDVWFAIKTGLWRSWYEKRISAAYQEGQAAGYQEGKRSKQIITLDIECTPSSVEKLKEAILEFGRRSNTL